MLDDITRSRLKKSDPSTAETPNEAAFVPPEEVAEQETTPAADPTAPDTTTATDTTSTSVTPPAAAAKKHWYSVKLSWPPTKKQWLVYAGILLFLIGLGVAAYFLFFKKDPPVQQTTAVVKKEVVVVPTTGPSPLTGVEVPLDQTKLPVTGVMIENSPDARPQSGLNDAGVVYEAVAEGGITRFLALYQEGNPAYLGPVRSVRPYYLDWLLPFDAAIAHVGGSPAALAAIKTLGVKDLDQFYNAGAYQRIPQRVSPHNVYTSRQKLLDLQNSKGWTTSTFTGFTRKKDEPPTATKVATAKTVDFLISGPIYSVHYDYDVDKNAYKRSEGGAPHTDEKSAAQLEPKVVIALVTNKSIDPDGQHTAYQTTGTGTMYVFQDGMVTTGTWQKADSKSQFIFTDANNQPLKLNAGQTWITVVGLTGDVSYKP